MKTPPVCFLLLTVAASLSAQKQNSGLHGVVTLAGSGFRGVEVEASSSSINQFWETSTDSAGGYVLNELPPGRYTVWVEATGHGCIAKSGVVVKIGAPSTQNFRFSKNKRYPGCESLKPRNQ